MAEWYNPMVPGFNPDPSVVRVGGFYCVVTSSFEYLPGLPIYRSADLIEWVQVGNVATRDAQVEVADVLAGRGLWAPTIRHRDGLLLRRRDGHGWPRLHTVHRPRSGRGVERGPGTLTTRARDVRDAGPVGRRLAASSRWPALAAPRNRPATVGLQRSGGAARPGLDRGPPEPGTRWPR